MATRIKTRQTLAVMVFAFVWTPGSAVANEVLKADPYVNRKAFFEDRWQQKIEALLKYVQGVRIAVSVELSRTANKTETIKRFEGDPIAITTDSSSSKTTEEHANPSDDGEESTGEKSKRTNNEKQRRTENAVPSTTMVSTYAGLTPERVSVSIGVPDSHYRLVWNHRHPESSESPSHEDLAEIEKETHSRIETAIGVLLPRTPRGEDQYRNVKVVTFDDLRD